jgi:hypothetical protein
LDRSEKLGAAAPQIPSYPGVGATTTEAREYEREFVNYETAFDDWIGESNDSDRFYVREVRRCIE